jgi:hypothetical protein
MTTKPNRRPLRRLFSAAARGLAGSRNGPSYCPDCRRPFMCPMEWETDGETHWLIQLRCGECGCWREVRLSNEEAADFDLALDRQMWAIRRTLTRLDRERMQLEVDAFVAALEHDLVDAADFAS